MVQATPLDGQKWSDADGNADSQVLKTDGAGNLSYTTISTGGLGNLPEDTTPTWCRLRCYKDLQL